MEKDLYLGGERYQDINPLFAGWEQCEPGKFFGPAMREYMLIHYIFSGTGRFIREGREYAAGPGQIFIIRPGELTYYEASREEPWEYVWVAFNGRLSEKFLSLQTAVLDVSGEVFEEIRDCVIEDRKDIFTVLSCIYRLYGEVFGEKHKEESNDYARQVKQYVKMKYMDVLCVESIAEGMHLNRRYLTRLFKARYGMTIRDYVIFVRMEQAKKYLRDGFSVRETATMVGYPDVFNFSKAFKKAVGAAPSAYKSSGTKH